MSRKTTSAARSAARKSAAARSVARPTRKPAPKTAPAAAGKRPPGAKPPAKAPQKPPPDLAATVDSLHAQINATLARLTELAAIAANERRVVIRTAPIDRATATFQRIVAEVVDDQLSEMLPPLVSLRNEMAQRLAADAAGDDLRRRACETLDHVLKLAGVQPFEARVGEPLDPVIHLAVGETNHGHLADGVVGEAIQCGFRTARGKVIVPARVRVNRR